ncbi:MAG TPA: hypothetical protein VN282_11330 [Pyrinomonadaceae bacterium]|nr:hypothetical protein [Pyrinomonadaceae bacterium]
MEFRLTVPRWGSQPLAAVFAQLNNIGTGGLPGAGAALAALGVVWPAGAAMVQADLDTMANMAALLGTNLGPGPAPNAPPPPPPLPPSPNVSQQRAATTDFPDVAFRLELLLSSLKFQLGPEWKPAMVEGSRFVRDSGRANEPVRFVLPKVALVCQQMSAGAGTLGFRLKSWGSGGFDAPADMAAGELVRMEPPLTIHESGRVGFGIDQIILDLSETSTPPEILKHFGTDEEWTGLYLKNLQFFYADESKEFAFNACVSDALISFGGEV